jgi:hypothetical protein
MLKSFLISVVAVAAAVAVAFVFNPLPELQGQDHGSDRRTQSH